MQECDDIEELPDRQYPTEACRHGRDGLWSTELQGLQAEIMDMAGCVANFACVDGVTMFTYGVARRWVCLSLYICQVFDIWWHFNQMTVAPCNATS